MSNTIQLSSALVTLAAVPDQAHVLSDQQRAWLNKLPDDDSVVIVPYNPAVKEVFEAQRAELLLVLGSDAVVLHKGASAWGISGKGDVDIYVPVAVERFDHAVELLKSALGEPGSQYYHERVRWNKQVDGIDVEIILVNQDAQFYRNNVRFWTYLETHRETLAAYERIKEAARGASMREYYAAKDLSKNNLFVLM